MIRSVVRWAVLAGGLLAAAAVVPAIARAQEVDAAAEQQMLGRINSMRHVTGLPVLQRNALLDEVARAHSLDMARNQMLEHVSPRTGDPGARVRRVGLEPEVLAENIARDRTAVDAYRSFIGSDAHRRNLMDERVTHIGLSIVKQGDEVWVTQLLARLPEETGAAPPAPTENPAATSQATAPASAVEAPVTAAPTGPAIPGVPAHVRAAGYWAFVQGRWWYYPPSDPSAVGPSTAPQNAPPTPPPPSAPAVRVRRCSAPPAFGWSPRRRYDQWRCTQGF